MERRVSSLCEKALLLLLLAVLFLAPCALSEDVSPLGKQSVTPEQAEEARLLASAYSMPTGVSVKAEFPNNPFKILTLGEVSTLELTIINMGEIKQSVYAVSGLLVSSGNFSHILRNLTAFRYDKAAEPSGNLSIPYQFALEVPPGEYGLVVLMDFLDTEVKHKRVVAYQDVIRVTEEELGFDLKSLSVYVIFVAFVLAVGRSVFYSFFAPASPSKKSSRKASAVVVEKQTQQEKLDDWMPEHLKPKRSSQRQGRKRHNATDSPNVSS